LPTVGISITTKYQLYILFYTFQVKLCKKFCSK